MDTELQGLDELYSMVLNQCERHREPDVMRATLEEKREAGGQLSPSGHAYAGTLSCLAKVCLFDSTVMIVLFRVVGRWDVGVGVGVGVGGVVIVGVIVGVRVGVRVVHADFLYC